MPRLSEVYFTRFDFKLVYKVLGKIFYLFFKIYRSLLFKNKNGAGVVIISLHRLGDTVFTFPAIKAIFDQFAGERITILCYKAGKEIYEYFFRNAEIITVDKNKFRMGYRIADSQTRKIINNLDPAIVLNLSPGIPAISLFINSRAEQIVGIDKEIYKGAYDKFSRVRTKPTLFNLYIDAVKLILPEYNFDTDPVKPTFSVSDKILIQPFAGWKSKEWGIDKYIKLAVILSNKFSVEFISETGIMSDEIKLELKRLKLRLIECNNVTELLNEIQDCFLMISNDTGAAHLAAALGKATYTIYGPTNPVFSQAKGSHSRLITKKLPCSPVEEEYCFTFAGQDGCPSFECMRQLSLTEVLNDLNKFIDQIELTYNGPFKVI